MSNPDLDSVQEARLNHQTTMREWAKGCLWFAVALGLLGGFLALPPMQALFASWGILPWLWLGPIIFSFVLICLSMWCFSQSHPIPNEALHAPNPFELVQDQPWRKPTKLRFLERMKEQITQAEADIQAEHESAMSSYRRLPHVITYSAYKEDKAVMRSSEYRKTTLLTQLPRLYEEAERIFRGDVGTELLDIEERIKKLQRDNEERRRLLVDGQGRADRCTADKPCKGCNEWNNERKPQLYREIHAADHRVIELETDLKELQNFDFRSLWKELNLPGPPELARVPKDRIDEMKAKIETINDIPSLKDRTPARPQLSREEKCEQERARIDAQMQKVRMEADERLKDATLPEFLRKAIENGRDDALHKLEQERRRWLT